MSMAQNKRILWLMLILKFIMLSTNPNTVRSSGRVPALISFGDSSVDTGNNNQIPTMAKSNFEPYGRDFVGGKPTGRFSNGKVPIDFISGAFGLKATVPAYLDPMYTIADFATGVCFASAATGYDNATSDVLGVIPLWQELEYYKEYQTKLKAHLGNKKANKIISEALYTMSLGTNDFLENYYTNPGGRQTQFTIHQYQDFLIGIARGFFTQLYRLGARKVSLTGVPPMGCLPLERTLNFMANFGCVDTYNQIGLEFNKKLSDLASELNQKLVGYKILAPDSYHIILQMIQKPKKFGYEVTSRGCCGIGEFEAGYICDRYNPFTCVDANKYVFWDSFHLTEKSNRLVSEHILVKLLHEFQ